MGLAHIVLVAGRYHVGSFDDDGAYLYMAKGIVGGTGLSGHLPNGFPLVTAYPPGYSYLLAPLLWLFGTGGGWWPERLASLACVAAVFPLTWIYLRRRGLSEAVCAAVLALLALNPVLATYGTMVMAEAPFLVAFLLLLLSADRWATSDRAWAWSGLATIVLAATAVWLKEAGVAMVAGLVGWLLWRREIRKAALAAAGCTALLMPIVVARLATGTPISGSRYSDEIGGYYQGDLIHRVIVAVPVGAARFLFDALPSAIVPTDSPVSDHLVPFVVFRGLACGSVWIFCIVGAVVWVRRNRLDAAAALIAVYAVECAAFKFVVERRVLLILPVAVAWYVIGAQASARWLLAVAARRRLGTLAHWRRGFVLAGCIGVLLPLLAQLPANYRFRVGQDTSAPGGSPYLGLLARVGRISDVVETDYLWTTALYTGHRTAWGAFLATGTSCQDRTADAALAADRASFLYTAAIDIPPTIDSPCLLQLAAKASWAVPLLHTAHDDATVFELIGKNTGHPDLEDLLSVRTTRTSPATRTSSSVVRALPSGAVLSQVSVGMAAAARGPTSSVAVRLLGVDGRWRTVTQARGRVGDGGTVPFLLATLPPGTRARSIEVRVGGAGGARLGDLQVLGTTATTPPAEQVRSGRL